jgi:hypothetical protein
VRKDSGHSDITFVLLIVTNLEGDRAQNWAQPAASFRLSAYPLLHLLAVGRLVKSTHYKRAPLGVGFECLALSLQERNTLYD